MAERWRVSARIFKINRKETRDYRGVKLKIGEVVGVEQDDGDDDTGNDTGVR